MECPNCQSENVHKVGKKPGHFVCLDCGTTWEQKADESRPASDALEQMRSDFNARLDRIEKALEGRPANEPGKEPKSRFES